VQYHSYSGSDLAPVIMDMTREAVQLHGKPFFLGEYGIPSAYLGKSAKVDPTGIQVHNGMWATAFAGGSGAGAIWCIGSHVDKCNLYFHYRGLARFAQRVPWNHAQLQPFDVDAPTFDTPPKELHSVDFLIPAGRKYVFEIPSQTDFTIGRDGAIEGAKNLRSMLHCKKGRKAPPTFHVNFDKPSQFVVSVSRSVGDESNKLIVRVDGEIAVEEPFPASKAANPKSTLVRQYGNWRTPYDKSVVVDVPAGAHTIRPEAVGKDRLEVCYALRGAIAVEHMRPLRAHGLRTDTAAYLWIQSRLSTWWNALKGNEPIPFAGMSTTLRGLPDGRYRVEWWDTWEAKTLGAVEAECTGGALKLSLPTIERDVACVVEAK